MVIDYLSYLFGGLIYLSSSQFRRKKKIEWENKGTMFKIYEVGMWTFIPFISLLLVFTVLVSEV